MPYMVRKNKNHIVHLSSYRTRDKKSYMPYMPYMVRK